MQATPSGKRKSGRWWALVAIAGFAAFTGLNALKLLTDQQEETQATAPVPVEVYLAKRTGLDHRLELIGNVQPMVSVQVFSRVPGQIIEAILLEKGHPVTRGDIVATLQRDVIDAQLAEARAGLAAAEAGRAQAAARRVVLEKDRARLTHLFAEKAVARQQVDHIEAAFTDAEQALRQADAQEARARAVIRQLMVQSADHTIRAPADGVIALRHVDPGTLTAPGVPIVTIADETRIKVVFAVTEKDLPRIREGLPVEVRVDAVADSAFAGSVALVSPTVDPVTRSADVEVHLANPESRLVPGMYARVSVLLERREGLAVPADGVIRVPGTGERFVFVVAQDRAVQRNVITGLAAETLIEIVEGVRAGEAVVVKGQGRLREGTPVQIVPTTAATHSTP